MPAVPPYEHGRKPRLLGGPAQLANSRAGFCRPGTYCDRPPSTAQTVCPGNGRCARQSPKKRHQYKLHRISVIFLTLISSGSRGLPSTFGGNPFRDCSENCWACLKYFLLCWSLKAGHLHRPMSCSIAWKRRRRDYNQTVERLKNQKLIYLQTIGKIRIVLRRRPVDGDSLK